MSKPAISTQLSRKTLMRRVAALVVLALFTGAISYPPAMNVVVDALNTNVGLGIPRVEKNFVLGLDLQGGTKLDYEADVSKIAEAERAGALNGVRDVIERRVNSLGVSEPLVTTAKAGESWRVSVELAGIRDVNQAINLIGGTPILEFKEENTEPQRAITVEEKKKMDETNAKNKATASTALAEAIKNPASFESLVQKYSEDNASKSLAGDLGFIKARPEFADVFAGAKGLTVGSIVPSVIEQKNSYVVAKVEETKSAGQEVKANHILISYAGATSAPTLAMSKEDAKKKIDQIRTEVNAGNFIVKAKEYSMEPGAAQSGGDLGWFGAGDMVPAFEKAAMEIKKGEISQVVESPFGFHIIYKADERPLSDVRVRAIVLAKLLEQDVVPPVSEWKDTALTGKQLSRSSLQFDDRSGSAQVALNFNEEGTKLFAEITKKNIGKRVAIFLDGQPISTPVVQTEITGGQAVISGSFTIPEAKLLAQRLQAGALPVPIKLISQQTVGPTLGQDSVDRSLMAGLWGFLLVTVFMLVIYRFPGLISILALVLYAGISGALFKTIPVTLTLSGIAGFILSLGIAVDANVLVYERLKEELREGKNLSMALEDAFRRAWPSIRDGHVTVLISCGVLYWFSSSMIKGFALTLAIGTVVSLFTAIVTARTMLRYAASTRLGKMRWLFLAPREPRV